MDPESEALTRSAIHDLANILSGIQGILELSDPKRPLSPRDRSRLDAILGDGMVVLERTRHLAMGTLPALILESGTEWRRQLQEQLEPLSLIFRRRIEVGLEGDGIHDRWPGELLRSYVLALTRQILPYAHDPVMSIQCKAGPEEWQLRWRPASTVPESISPGAQTRPRDISSRWAQRIGGSMGITLVLENGTLLARIPR